MEKTLFFRQNLEDEKMLYLRVMGYRNSKAIYIVLVSADFKDAGRPFKVVTTKPDTDIPAFWGAVDVEDKDWAQILIKNDIARPTTDLVYAGFRSLHLFEFDEQVLREYDPQGTEDYLERVEQMC